MIKQVAGAVVFGLAFAASAQAAQPSDTNEMRGYTNCQAALEAQLGTDRLAYQRNYFVKDQGNERTFYVNATGFEGSERVPFAATCVTPDNGTVVAQVDVREGRFVTQPGQVSIDLASR